MSSAVKMGINATQTTQWAIMEQANKTKLTEEDLPEQYQDYWDVFSEEKVKRFPPEREDDHEINFTLDAPKSFGTTMYKMEPKAVEFLRKWQNEELAKGFIRYSKSQYTCPTFLINKKNGEYRVVQDYKKLNEHTILDNTGPPLISELIDRLHRKTLFTKFDVCMGYNNICIKNGHQHKAAFTTPLGVFEPMVMNFGLWNTPGTFLRMMNKAL